ncbi:MAG: rRNA maturation RNase YbeY [Sulfolobales archaeon]
MPTSNICYFTEDTVFELHSQEANTTWIQQMITQEGAQLVHLNFIFCSDAYLHAQNVQYLQHDTLTDVITFSYSEDQHQIEGDIYISIDRVEDNATMYKVVFWEELYRVMAHGVLHLLGYRDKTKEQQAQMREKEDFYLVARRSMSKE